MKINNRFKSMAVVSALAVSSLSLQSCTEDQLTATIAVIAVAAVLSDDTPVVHREEPRYDRGPGWDRGPQYDDQDCVDYRDCRDDQVNRRDPGFRPGPGPGPHRRFASMTTASIAKMQQFALSQTLNERAKIEIMANKYSISTAAAQTLQNALDKAQQKDFSGVDQIGIAHSDLQSLYDNKKVSRYTLVNISAALGISFDQAKIFVATLQKNIVTAKALVK